MKQSRTGRSVLVTGGCGFIGTNLVNRLVREGLEVKVLDVAATEGLVDERGVAYIKGDMSSRDFLAAAIEGVGLVYHLAWSTIPKTSNEDPVFDVTSNLAGTLKLMDACVGAGVGKVVFLSSGGTVYGAPGKVPIPEDSPLEPINSYGINKLATEKYMELYRRMHGLDYAVIRPSNPFGPHQNPLGQVGTIAVFMYRMLAGKQIRIWGDGSVVRDYIYIDDLVDGLVLAGRDSDTEAARKRLFNMGSGEGTSLLELIDMISAATGKKPDVAFEPGRVFDVPVNVLDNSRAKAVLGWSPATPLKKGVALTHSWMKGWLARKEA